MKQAPDGTVVLSASDVTQALTCEWRFVRLVEAQLGMGPKPVEEADPMTEITSVLGNRHELALLEKLSAEHDGDVVEIAPPWDRGDDQQQGYFEHLEDAVNETRQALAQRRRVVFQGAFFDGAFQGFADFLVWNEKGFYEVYDSKLARSAKVSALLQLAAYAEQLRGSGIPVGQTVYLMLGSGEIVDYLLADIEPVYQLRMRKLRHMVEERSHAGRAGFGPARWSDGGYSFCGECGSCEEEIVAHDDLLQVSDMRRDQRAKIMAQGLSTMELFAHYEGPIEGLNPRSHDNLKQQALAQVRNRREQGARPYFTVDRPEGLLALPDPSPGDLFFDFEGDPLYQEGERWGIDYLFGWVDAEGQFDHHWVDSLADEKEAFEKFVDLVLKRRAEYPDMHVYHYASYEQTHLLQLAQRHGTREEDVDQFAREHVLVNMLPLVKNSLRLGQPSYSIKYLEKVYLSTPREGDTTNAVDSVVDYHAYRAALEAGDHSKAHEIKASVLKYNTTDCESTRELFHWLLPHRPGEYIPPEPRESDSQAAEDPHALRDALRSLVADVKRSERTANDHAVALAAEALEYHRREGRTFWWSHFRRLSDPIPGWEDERGVVMVNGVRVVRDWEPKRTVMYRQLEIQGRFAPGTTLKQGEKPFVVYDLPPPAALINPTNPHARGASTRSKVVEAGEGWVLIEEGAAIDDGEWNQVPLALTPSTPPNDKALRTAIVAWATGLEGALLEGQMPHDPALDILRRQPPRAVITYPDEVQSVAEAITQTVVDLDYSYLAIQGPPGTGKTYNAAQVIANLVHRGWKVGVVAQSHAAIENVLESVAGRGIDASDIGKKQGLTQVADAEKPWTWLKENTDVGRFLQEPGGCVVGGTTWTFCSDKAVTPRGLDLIVVEEAGQYSLANTIAVSVATKRLLLLGDPQQLPEVTQGSHPEPINTSALGWLSRDHDVLPKELGIFLETTRRMHPDLCDVVSTLSYEGRLDAMSHPDRQLEGVAPGLHTVAVEHFGNSVESAEEAEEVVRIVGQAITRSWTEGTHTAPLGQWKENIIVVAPYNAQVNRIRRALDEAGFDAIPVGTVDKFQGQEAVVAIVSMAASSLEEVPRGLDFLLQRNRLNVAISRAKWAAYLVYSPGILEWAPKTPEQLALLSRFASLAQHQLPDPSEPFSTGR